MSDPANRNNDNEQKHEKDMKIRELTEKKFNQIYEKIDLKKLVYLNRVGWFCQSCRDQLVAEYLILDSDSIDNLSTTYG